MAKNAKNKRQIRQKAAQEGPKNGYHTSVMLYESIDFLNVKEGGLYFDGTLGGGGHSELILKKGGNLIASDKDADAIEFAKQRLSALKDIKGSFTLIKDDFKNVKAFLGEQSITQIDGAILDLGISSHHIDEAERGFSYMKDGSLDMRMDKDQDISAYDIVNTYKEEELANLIYTFGEERFSRRIAARIIEKRKISPIKTTLELSELVTLCVPFNRNGGHAAKKTFQALRIAVNDELLGLSEAVSDLIDLLKSGGRLSIITFHSLEDRIVKNILREKSTDCICDKTIPLCICNHKAILNKKATSSIKPSIKEQEENPRSRSAMLRIAEKL